MNENPEFRTLEPVSNRPAIERLPIGFAPYGRAIMLSPGRSELLPLAQAESRQHHLRQGERGPQI